MKNFNKHDMKVIAILILLISVFLASFSLQGGTSTVQHKLESTSFNFWARM